MMTEALIDALSMTSDDGVMMSYSWLLGSSALY